MEIETINIIVSTNVSNEKEFSLTKNTIYHPSITDTSKYSEYPFFTKYVDYSKIVGYIDITSYNKVVETFFIESSFKNIMKLGYKVNAVDDENMNKIANYNVDIMLKLLFPTTYPVTNNYENTFNTLIGSSDQGTPLSNIQSIFSLFNPNQYSYIKTSGHTYSIVKCVWLNDFFNHPKYFKLMEEYKKLLKWKVAQNKKLKGEIKKKIKALVEHLKRKDVQDKLLYVNDKDNIKYNSKDQNKSYDKQLDKFKESIREIVKNVQTSPNEKNNEENIFTSLQPLFTDMIDSYDILFQVVKDRQYEYTRFNIVKDSLKKQVEFIIKLDKEIKVYNIVVDLHITDGLYDPISFVFSDERAKEMVEKYSQISNFKKLLESYSEPNKQSTNYKLQIEIGNFQKSYENVLQDIMDPTNLLVDTDQKELAKKIESIREYLNVGVCFTSPFSDSSESKTPPNEIYIKLFVINGELNDENKNIVNCMYKGDYLGDELYRLLNNDKSNLLLNVSNFQFDIDSKEVKAKIEESTKANVNEKKNPESKPPPQQKEKKPKSNKKQVKGGSRRNQKRKRRSRKTRKLFFI
jgi:hypothetical protein